jgi:hypothetical protein
MNSSCQRRRSASLVNVRVRFDRFLSFCIIAAAISALAIGCASSPAFQAVADQNAANSTIYAANVATLASAASELSQTESGAMLRRARECVSQDLTRLRATITPGDPTDAELSDIGASWTRSLITQAAALTTRINSVPPAQRAAIADSLAADHPATIDLAIATSGFTSARVLRDATELDRINATIQRETNADVRAGVMARRDVILDNYLHARRAAESAARFNTAIASLIATIDQQGRILGLHAEAMKSYANGKSAPSGAIGVFRDPDLRVAILQLVSDASGDRAAEEVRERLRRIDDGLSVFETARR